MRRAGNGGGNANSFKVGAAINLLASQLLERTRELIQTSFSSVGGAINQLCNEVEGKR